MRTLPSSNADFLTVAALRKLDLISSADVVGWAGRNLVQTPPGFDVDLLASLSVQRDETDKTLAELVEGRIDGPLSDEDAGLLAAADVARSLGDGHLSPIDAARMIWDIARRAPAAEPILRPFIGLASEWDDDPDHRELIDEEIRSRAASREVWAID